MTYSDATWEIISLLQNMDTHSIWNDYDILSIVSIIGGLSITLSCVCIALLCGLCIGYGIPRYLKKEQEQQVHKKCLDHSNL